MARFADLSRYRAPVRIAFAFNMLRDGGEAEAEFDTPETVGFVAGLLEGLGHEVERIDAGVRLDSFVERLAASAPVLEPYGVLAGVEYEFAGPGTAIYHFQLENERSEDVEVRAPASLTPEQEVELAEAARVVFDTCSIRDLARADFRLAVDGTLWFLEVNPLPSLEDGAGIYAAAALECLSPKDVVAAVAESALRRHAAGVPS